MKKYILEFIVGVIQILVFYLFPLTAGPTDIMGLVILLILVNFILSMIMGIFSGKNIKYLYPVIISLLFIPSVFIYYNESAFIHSLWHFVTSYIGLIIGICVNKIK